MSDRLLANLTRVLALTTVVLLAVSVLEARSIRELRGDVQRLRDERASVTAGQDGAWARQDAGEFVEATRWLQAFYAEPTEGFGRPGGLCAQGNLDPAPIAQWVLRVFLPARAAGRSMDAAIAEMQTGLRSTDDWKRLHGGQAAVAR